MKRFVKIGNTMVAIDKISHMQLVGYNGLATINVHFSTNSADYIKINDFNSEKQATEAFQKCYDEINDIPDWEAFAKNLPKGIDEND